MEWILVVVVWLVCGFICEYMGKNKGQKNCFWYGFLLGIIGIIIVACLKDRSGEVQNEVGTNLNKYDQLEKLQQLKNNGTLTDAEFEVEKSKLLK